MSIGAALEAMGRAYLEYQRTKPMSKASHPTPEAVTKENVVLSMPPKCRVCNDTRRVPSEHYVDTNIPCPECGE